MNQSLIVGVFIAAVAVLVLLLAIDCCASFTPANDRRLLAILKSITVLAFIVWLLAQTGLL